MIWETVDNESRVRHAEIALQDILDSTPFQKIGLHVRLGEPAREIVTFAEHVKAELIVLPSHGRTGLSRLLIGSVAERVVRMAHCPVLILRGLSHKDG
jgi:nucleotide-binding universal stress UspA family protein